jgi:hypothetical protein
MRLLSNWYVSGALCVLAAVIASFVSVAVVLLLIVKVPLG